jgi:hypothetical protein
VNRHDDRIRAFSFATDAAIPAAMFDMFLELVRSVHGPNLLRLKGIVKLAETPASPVVIHGVQHIFHPVVRLPRWPDGDERTRIVLITRDLDPDAVKRLFDAFLGASAPDQPDRAALLGNPLVPFGGPRSLISIITANSRALLTPCHSSAGARCWSRAESRRHALDRKLLPRARSASSHRERGGVRAARISHGSDRAADGGRGLPPGRVAHPQDDHADRQASDARVPASHPGVGGPLR